MAMRRRRAMPASSICIPAPASAMRSAISTPRTATRRRWSSRRASRRARSCRCRRFCTPNAPRNFRGPTSNTASNRRAPNFVSIPIDDWTRPAQPIEARRVSRELGPDPEGMKALVAALAASKRPALVVGPGVDRAGAVDLMVQVAEKAKAAVWVSPFSARCSFPERHPQFAGFLHASPGQLSDALHDHDLVVVIGAPVFTFHVEGHASIFDGGATIFQITDDADAAAVTPSGTSIIATMKPALTMLLELLPETSRAIPAGRALPSAPQAGDPIPV